MKKIIISILAITSVLTFTSCSKGNIQSNTSNTSKSLNIVSNKNEVDKEYDNVIISNMSAKMVKYYENVDELNADSELILKGKVVKNEYTEYDDMIFTISTLKVEKVIKSNGTVKNGDTISVLQTGGITTIKENSKNAKSFESAEGTSKFINENKRKKIETVLEDAPVVKENKTVILFLDKYEGPVVKDAYVGTGDFQGRFLFDTSNNSIKPQSKYFKGIVSYDTIMNFTK